MVKYLLTALAVVAPFTPTHQVHDNFTTFETASYFNDAFGHLEGYQSGVTSGRLSSNTFEIDYEGENYNYYVFPIYYDVSSLDISIFYSNNQFNFYLNADTFGEEQIIEILIDNYVGVENVVSFGRLNSQAMSSYINNEKGKGIVSDIIGTISSMVTGLLAGIGSGVVGMFNSLFLDGSNISSLGIWFIVLLGLSIALGAVAWVSTLIRGKQR